MEDAEFIKSYEQDIERLNCKHADEHGRCSIYSTPGETEYCHLGICPSFEEAKNAD